MEEEKLYVDENGHFSHEPIGKEVTREFQLEIFGIQGQIADCKNQLYNSDYKTLKYLEGAITEEEFNTVKAERAALRARVNELEEQIKELIRNE